MTTTAISQETNPVVDTLPLPLAIHPPGRPLLRLIVSNWYSRNACADCGADLGEINPDRCRQFVCHSCLESGRAKQQRCRVERESPPYYIACTHCGVGMKASRRDTLYCSQACGAKATRSRSRVEKACETCGTAFMPARTDTRFCSAPCKQTAYRRRRVTDKAVARERLK